LASFCPGTSSSSFEFFQPLSVFIQRDIVVCSVCERAQTKGLFICCRLWSGRG
jgi:hypothetical protein